MLKKFSHSGLLFHYPSNWTLEEHQDSTSWTVTLQSPGTAFFVVQHQNLMPTLEQTIDTVLEALRQEYSDLEETERMETIGGQPAIGYDVAFFSLDLTNSCWTRSFFTAEGTALLLYQVTDHELETYKPVFDAICASIQIEEDD